MPLRQFDIAGELLDGSHPRSPRAGASPALLASNERSFTLVLAASPRAAPQGGGKPRPYYTR